MPTTRRRGAGALAAAAVLGTGLAGLAAPSALAAPGAHPVSASSRPQPPAPISAAARRAAVVAQADALVARSGRALRAAAGERFTSGASLVDADGTSHVRYTRTHAGLPVLGGDAVVHVASDGALAGVSQTLTRPVRVGTTPQVAKGAAVATAVRTLPGTVRSSSARLVVDATRATPRLAWEVVLHGVRRDQTPSVLHVRVDAATGAVLGSDDEVETGTGNSIYSGQVALGTSRNTSTGSYELKDPTRGGNYTTDLNQATTGTGTLFTDADDVWGTGTTASRQSAAVDAHYGAQTTFDYYKNVLGRNGIFNNGTGVRSRVHYGNAYVNAFWDGTQMTYGDGSSNTHPLVELDVAGHEMSHGVTENTAGLTYSGESGGLNEATSDIFGTMVEFYANNPSDVPDYLIGEKIDLNGNGTPLRYMDRPSRDGSSPDCWSSTLGSLDPHQSSGPGNHVFYLLAEGSGAKTINGVSYNSPTCNGGTVTGAGRDAAAKIWYRALSVYMTSGTTYAGARSAAVSAAKDLYGAASTQCASVEQAFSAIAVTGATCATGGGTGTNLVANPGFESGTASWTSSTGVITSDATRAHAGSYLAWLDGYGSAHTDTLSQAVTIPAATKATLSLWLRVATNETTTSTAYDTLKLQVVSGTTTSTVATYSNLNASTGYVQRTLDLSAYAGKSVTLKLVGAEDSSAATSFLVDDLSLTTG